MTLDLMHARRGRDDTHARRASSPPAAAAASCTRCSPTASRRANARASTQPNFVKPETAHPAFDKACHLLGVELRQAPIDPETTQVDVDVDRRHDRREHRRDHRLGLQLRLRHDRPDRGDGRLALERGVGLHVDGCLGGFILPWGQELGYDIPPFDFRVPGVTTHLGRHPQVRLRPQGHVGAAVPRHDLRRGQYFFLTDWSGGKYCSPGIDGSRSGGLLAATWAAMRQPRPRGLPRVRQGRSSRPRSRCRTR